MSSSKASPFVKIKKSFTAGFSVLIIGSVLAGCSPRISSHGNYPREDQLDQFEVGKTTQNNVFQTLGPPTSRGSFDSNVWYYMTQQFKREAFFEPELTDLKVIAFYFDEKGTYIANTTYDLDDVKRIALEKEITETSGNEYGILQQLFGTITNKN